MTDVLVPAADAPADAAPGSHKPDNCPFCGSHYQAGPEAETWAKHWHCWHCGYDPDHIPSGAIAAPASFGGGASAAVAHQIAAQIRENLGLPAGVNLGDLLASLRPQAQAAVPAQAEVEQ